MTDKATKTAPGRLNLPAPDSPRELDDKILRYARQRAPAAPLRTRSWWLGGLATASIAAVALLITLPRQTVQVPLEQREERRAERSQRSGETPMAIQASPAQADAAATPPTATTVAKQGRPENSVRTEASGKSPAIAEKADLKAKSTYSDQPGSSTGAEDYADQATGASSPAEAEVNYDTIGDSSPGGAETDIQASATLSDPPATGAVAVGQLAPMPAAENEINDTLRELARLYEAGEQQQARQRYRQFLQQCADCTLPGSLEQAMVDYLGSKQD